MSFFYPDVAFSLPQGLFLMTGFIDSIPWEMEEAAVMDGCGIYRIVFQIITPILMLISTCLFVRNYHRTMAEERELCRKDVENLSGNLDTLLEGMVEFGTYICINNDILAILSSDDAQTLNRDSQLWVHEAPMRTLQDMIALSGQIKTLAIYPENGVNPYLRCADAAAYISSIEEIRRRSVTGMRLINAENILLCG